MGHRFNGAETPYSRREPERVRYAFLTANEAGQIRDLDAHDLAATDAGAAKIWDRGVQDINFREEGMGNVRSDKSQARASFATMQAPRSVLNYDHPFSVED